jgi:dienelactone hydrolase
VWTSYYASMAIQNCFRSLLLLCVCLPTGDALVRAADIPKQREGAVDYRPSATDDRVAERFRLAAHRFTFKEQVVSEQGARIIASKVTFPSPVVTPHESNNTVHCEYFRPAALSEKGSPAKRYPAVVVLHILGGDFPLSRLFCKGLANRNVGALFVKMPYYGPRRPQGVNVRMISHDPRESVAGMTQAILDIRRAAAWLAAQDEVDPAQLGVFGISLGGITACLAATAEPRFAKVCPILAGGDISQIAWESPELARVRQKWIEKGETKESIVELLKSIDPVTYAENVRGRSILMFNASRDEVIPRRCTDSLWQAFGKPPIIWYEAGHYTAIFHLLDVVQQTAAFFQPDWKPPTTNPKR